MAEEQDQPEPRPTDTGETAPSGSDAVAAGNDPADAVAAAVNAGVDRILQAFDEKLRYDESKQRVIDRQHDELMGHRANLVAQAARPFILGMIRHHGEIGKLLAAVGEQAVAELPSTKVCELLESLQEDVEDVLGEHGVDAYRAEVSEPFDPVRQTAIGKAVPTTDVARSGTVAACLGPGFEHDGRILVKARVAAYRFEPPPPDS